jgi:polyisoprenoid-binding protein YceI
MLPEESQLSFTGTQNDAPLKGTFKSFTAKINFDPDALNESSIDVVVDMNSLNLSYQEAKTTLIGSDWFDVKLFPKAEFKASKWKRVADDNFQAEGTLTIRDRTLPVTLNFKTKKLADNKASVEGSTIIKRTAFGVGQGEWSNTSEVKDDVTVAFKVVAVKK